MTSIINTLCLASYQRSKIKSLLCPSLEVFTGKGARNFGEVVSQLWGGKKKRRRNSTIVIYNEYNFYTIVGFSISIKLCYTVASFCVP